VLFRSKINAIDQWAQLARYHTDYTYSTIVYLTLLGKSASSYSKNKKVDEKDYLRISYKEDIRKWLNQCLNYLQDENCKLDVERKNKLSILIIDYLTVINELTYRERRNDIILPKLSKDLDTVKFVFDNQALINKLTKYKDIIVPLKKYLVREMFVKIILKNLIDDIGGGLLYKINEGKDIMQKGWGFQFYKENWEEYNIKIGFYFMKRKLENCIFGLLKYNPNNPTIPIDDIKPKNGWYYINKEIKLGEYSKWHRKTFYEFISDDIKETPFYKLIKTIILEMCNKVDHVIINKIL
jgi:hypothetical protein